MLKHRTLYIIIREKRKNIIMTYVQTLPFQDVHAHTEQLGPLCIGFSKYRDRSIGSLLTFSDPFQT